MFSQKLELTIDLHLSYGFVHFDKGYLKFLSTQTMELKGRTKDFKHEFLKPYKDNTLSDMVVVLIDQFLPAKDKKYIIT